MEGLQLTRASTIKPLPVPRHGHRWGPWVYNRHDLTLEHKPVVGRQSGYYIDLEQCVSSAETLDRIVQVSRKTWCTAKATGQLITALESLLKMQGNLCSFGREQGFHGKTVKQFITQREQIT